MAQKRAGAVSEGRVRRDALRPGPSPASARAFVDALQASRRYVFTKEEALNALEASEPALKNAFWRLSKAGRLVCPRRGFCVIVPLEYRAAGSLPPAWFIRELMAYLHRPYYVGLLSAAALYGAAHQAPQEFQVVTDRPLRPIEVGVPAAWPICMQQGIQAAALDAPRLRQALERAQLRLGLAQSDRDAALLPLQQLLAPGPRSSPCRSCCCTRSFRDT